MGLTGKVSVELEIKSSPDKYFQGVMNHQALFHKALPDGLHKSEVHEGDGKNVDSILHYNYVLDGNNAVTCKGKIETVDKVNKIMSFFLFDGHVGELYSKYKLIIQVFTKDRKNFANYTIEYEKLSEEVPEPLNYLELKTRFCKGLDVHISQA